MSTTTTGPLRTIVLVEPLCRGSRLQIVANALAAMRGRANVILITRRDYRSDHFNELVTSVGLEPRIITVDTDLGGAWMKNLSRTEFNAFFLTLRALEMELAPNGTYDLVFMALDDYLIAFSTFAVSLKSALRNANVICVKYRVEYLFALSRGFRTRGIALRLMTRWSLYAAGAKLICFDERLAALKPSYLGGLLPDPWFGLFSPVHREEGRLLLGVNSSDFVLLALGKQDRRKGIDFLIDVFPSIATNPRVKLAVVGAIAAPFEVMFLALKERFPQQIVHVNKFVSEEHLPKYFSAPDVFLMPYSEDFTATSGTLARASASGVSVLATAHGLVGHRIRQYELGETFEAYNRKSFAEALQTLMLRTSDQQCTSCVERLKFTEMCSLPKFESALCSALAI